MYTLVDCGFIYIYNTTGSQLNVLCWVFSCFQIFDPLDVPMGLMKFSDHNTLITLLYLQLTRS